MSIFDDVIVGYGPEQIEDIEVHERPDGSSVIETVTCRPVRVWEKRRDGSLVELHDEAADAALDAFWAAVDNDEINDDDMENDR
ncbi:hypothetical protein A4E84_29850 [Streptomyces qaidamensis]|uniref:Uncharacterized protein n=1 Tax=Streptomyces qaidamensis TaxID=1783515 RepID=A0A143C7A5_9ACTN|nr:hypothetical protein [Streptomyces qaidamensis]AMW13332.1 hypothetical protein A4E84_29850 [Streptomyces qaidamensis]